MRSALFGLGLAFLAGCTDRESRSHADVMDAIEGQVVLPSQAQRLDRYARYYARGLDGGVVATYVLPEALRAEVEACEGLDCQTAPLLEAGHRRWLSNLYELPVVKAPACALVVLTYNEAERQIEELRCTEGLS